MIIQSHKGYVELLPALPSNWSKGAISGVRVRGGFEINVSWDRMQVSELEVTCKATNQFTLKTSDSLILFIEGKEAKTVKPKDGFISLAMNKGQKYKFIYN